MAEVICMASSKGGSGKTTITATIGAFLARTGRRVLMIDCDEGTHGLTLMYLNEVNSLRKSSNTLLRGTFEYYGKENDEVVMLSGVTIEKNLKLLPARFIFNEQNNFSIGKEFESILANIIHHCRDDFDFILLDAQAGLSDASKAAMSSNVSNLVILASEYDPMSNAGIERLKARLPDELDVGRTWILLNKLLPEFVAKFSEFLSVARYLPPIPWTADVVRAYSRRRLALDFDNGNQFTLAILSVLRELLDGQDLEALEEWVEEQTQRLKEPIEEQLKDAQTKLAQMQILAKGENEADKNIITMPIRSYLLRMVSLITLLGGFIAVLNFFARNGSGLLDKVLIDGNLVTLVGVAIAGLTAAYASRVLVQETFEIRDQMKRESYKRIAEIRRYQERVDELQSLTSAGFEDIVLGKSNKDVSK